MRKVGDLKEEGSRVETKSLLRFFAKMFAKTFLILVRICSKYFTERFQKMYGKNTKQITFINDHKSSGHFGMFMYMQQLSCQVSSAHPPPTIQATRAEKLLS
jgi:hypothetical protein